MQHRLTVFDHMVYAQAANLRTPRALQRTMEHLRLLKDSGLIDTCSRLAYFDSYVVLAQAADLRTPRALQRTMEHLRLLMDADVTPPPEGMALPFTDLVGFLWDRHRQLRKDVDVQRLTTWGVRAMHVSRCTVGSCQPETQGRCRCSG
jgi:hypothetical protein